MNQFRPHLSPRPKFEGFYSKFDLPSAGHLVLIICSVPGAKKRRHMVSFAYIPPSFPVTPYFQREIWADDIRMIDQPPRDLSYSSASKPLSTLPLQQSLSSEDKLISFQLIIPDVGFMTVYTDNSTIYQITDPSDGFKFSAYVPGGNSSRTPWIPSDSDSTPEGFLVRLPLPLHWHVHSLASTCSYSLTIDPSVYPYLHYLDNPTSPSNQLRALDQTHGPTLAATVHQEKNWAYSFPQSHIWIRAHNPVTKTSLGLAGGAIIGTQAYLLTYHAQDPSHCVSFAPPYSMTLPFLPSSFSPTLSTTHSWSDRSFSLTTCSLTHKISIEASAPKGTFIGFSAPFTDEHRANFLGQSFAATVRVRVWIADRMGFGHWRKACEEVFEGAGLEFGGEAYGERSSESWVN